MPTTTNDWTGADPANIYDLFEPGGLELTGTGNSGQHEPTGQIPLGGYGGWTPKVDATTDQTVPYTGQY